MRNSRFRYDLETAREVDFGEMMETQGATGEFLPKKRAADAWCVTSTEFSFIVYIVL
jgi:hypothetical protein